MAGTDAQAEPRLQSARLHHAGLPKLVGKERGVMRREVAVTELLEVACRQDEALAVIRDIRTIEQTEVKVDSVQVLPRTERTGTYKARGYFAFIPWHNEFAYVLH